MKVVDSFYVSPAWRKLRARIVRRDGYCCVVCKADVSRPGGARVDHIKTRRDHPHLALDPANLRTLCPRCDNQRHREKGAAEGAGGPEGIERFVILRKVPVGVDGWPTG